MRSFLRPLTAALLVPLLAACDDDGTGVDRLLPSEVAGRYAVCTLTFTPSGAQPSIDLRARAFQTSPAPELRLNATQELQLVFVPSGEGQFVEQNIRGVFRINGQVVELDFDATGTRQPASVLLQDPLRLNFQGSPQTLSIGTTSQYDVPRADYARLAGIPEAGLAERIPGALAATFRAGGCS